MLLDLIEKVMGEDKVLHRFQFKGRSRIPVVQGLSVK